MNKLYAGLLSIGFLVSVSTISATCDEACRAACAIVSEVTDKGCGCKPLKAEGDDEATTESEVADSKNLDVNCGCGGSNNKPKPKREASEDSEESDEAAEQN